VRKKFSRKKLSRKIFLKKVGLDITPVAGVFLKRLGFERIFKTQGIFKTQNSALLVLWKGVINPANIG